MPLSRQNPSSQTSVSAQLLPHTPQFNRSARTFTHWLPQRSRPVRQGTQAPARHSPLPQLLPQRPQCEGSSSRSVSHPVAIIPSQSPRPGKHAAPQTPATQVAVWKGSAVQLATALLLSVTPSQSSSALLQRSVTGVPAVALQKGPVVPQTMAPVRAQAPRPEVHVVPRTTHAPLQSEVPPAVHRQTPVPTLLPGAAAHAASAAVERVVERVHARAAAREGAVAADARGAAGVVQAELPRRAHRRAAPAVPRVAPEVDADVAAEGGAAGQPPRHVPPMQLAVPPRGGVHDRLHAPQCRPLLLVSTHCPPHTTPEHCDRQVPLSQSAPVGHAPVHDPQRATSVRVFTSQPLVSMLPSQFAKPARQAYAHWPLAQPESAALGTVGHDVGSGLLSGTPSQSSSIPLQISGSGSTSLRQRSPAPMHWVMPSRQRPTPRRCVGPVKHACEGSSSVAPSQLSSTPLQLSGRGPTSPLHAPQAPALQDCVPARQTPTPGVPEVAEKQGRASASSMLPSQLSSTLLQTSTPGAPSTASQLGVAPAQRCGPLRAQAPRPRTQVAGTHAPPQRS